MRSRFTLHFLLVLFVFVAAFAPSACKPKSPASSASGGSMSAGSGGAGNGTGGMCTGFCNTSSGSSGTLTLMPPNATITVVDGVASPVTFMALEGGQPVFPAWQVDLSAIASVSGMGVVTATGKTGGAVVLTAKLNGETATASVTVNLKRTINLAMASPANQALLKAPAGPDAAITWAYPYDKTVFPKGLLAQKMMWNGGGAGDLYRIHLAGKFTDFDFFTTADPPSGFKMDEPSWTQLTESGTGGTIQLEVDRLPAGAAAATKVINHSWLIANGSMKGTVYYWSNNLGRVLRIKPGAAAPEDFLPPAGVDGTHCTTCHTVSANGSTLVIGGDATISTFDLLTNSQVFDRGPTPYDGNLNPRRAWAMATLSPDGNVLIENNAPLPGPPGAAAMAGPGDGLFDSHTGTQLTGLGLDGILLDMPAFGPSGTKIAFVQHASGPPFASNVGALGVFDYDAATHKVSNPVKLIDMGASNIAFPSMSPDAKSIVYHRGSLDTRYGPGDLYLASVAQPGVETKLANLDGDAYPFAAGSRDLHYNYEPTFAPVNAGGFAWVVFTSRRTYGNELVGPPVSDPGPPPVQGVKQLWVAAIDQTVTPGVDPSHPAFRLTGQDSNLNMRGFWALDPCKQAGASCASSSECCDMNCDQGVCKDATSNGCSPNGSACMAASDCCDAGSQCINSVCSPPPPQ